MPIWTAGDVLIPPSPSHAYAEPNFLSVDESRGRGRQITILAVRQNMWNEKNVQNLFAIAAHDISQVIKTITCSSLSPD